MRLIYLDNSATTKISSNVITKMAESLEVYGNPSSLHHEGQRAMTLITESREKIAKLIGAKTDEIIFTSGGTESNNTVINIACELVRKSNTKKEIIVSAIEHPSILEALKHQNDDIKVTYLPVDKSGRVIIKELKKLLNNETALVSVMSANNETGVIQDIKEIAKLAHNIGALVHTDAVQSIGKIDFDVKDLDVDYASFSAHKINGPKGIGALYVKKSAPYSSLLLGGHQEAGKRAGTYNTLGIAGFGQAAQDAQNTPKKYLKKTEPIKNKLREEILKFIPNVIINGDQGFTLPNVLNVSFPGAEGESIILFLDHYKIETSTGSACASGDGKPSHVLMAMLADPELAHGSVRFSFSLENTMQDIERVMKYLPNIIKNLREISTIRTGDKNE